MRKDSPIMQIVIGTLVLVIAAAVVGIFTLGVQIRDTMIDHGKSLNEITVHLMQIDVKLEQVPTRTEVNNKLAILRDNLGADHKVEHAAEQSMEYINRN